MEKIERREYPVELRVSKEGDKTKIRGHAAVFNSLSVDLGGFREQIAPGAFADTINSDDVRALFNHDPNLILGRTASGTLSLNEDNTGLHYELTPPDTQTGRDVMTLIARGDITQNSFGFRVLPDGDKWDEDANGQLVRTLTKVKLFDVSPVTYPAYPQTDISLRSSAEVLEEAKEVLARMKKEPEEEGKSVELAKKMIELNELY